MKKFLFLFGFIPVLSLAQDLKFNEEEWEEELFDFDKCFCPRIIQSDSAIIWDKKNFSPYKWDDKPVIIMLDSTEHEKYKELFINEPIFTFPEPQPKDKKQPTL
ncbi:MAG: hypothetical protein AAF600_13235 [Bacteroidota bacterium]